MASSLTYSLLFFQLILISAFFITTHGVFSEQSQEPKESNKMTHLHFYFNDIVSGKHPTAVTIAGAGGNFGTTMMADDPLTEGPEPGSKVVGSARGMYGLASQQEAELLMVMNFSFSEGAYNGSSIGVLGRNRFLEAVREMPVVGGSGVFRFARGYALAKTVKLDFKTGDAVVEYNVFVMHAA